jgi:hypothetical protein
MYGTEGDITARIRKGQIAFSALNNIWHSTAYSTQTDLCIFNTKVKAVLPCGCETWKKQKSVTAKLKVFVNKCLRKILRMFWPDQITNSELWKRKEQPRIHLQISKRKWLWLGLHCGDLSTDTDWQALQWNPQGKRGWGRPGNTWRRAVLEEAKGGKKTWTEIKSDANNRVRWRFLVEALCSAAEWRDIIYITLERM